MGTQIPIVHIAGEIPPGAEGFVIAGGRSSRMGADKAQIRFRGKPLIATMLDKLRVPQLALLAPPRVAASRVDLAAYAGIVEDLHPGCGPLAGIEAALAATTQDLNLFVPVDLPLLPAEFLCWMFERACITGAWVTMPKMNGRAQPLCAIYHRCLLNDISRSLKNGRYKVLQAAIAGARENSDEDGRIDLFDVETIAATCPEVHAFSKIPLHRWFYNLNSPDDLSFMERLAGSRSNESGIEQSKFQRSELS